MARGITEDDVHGAADALVEAGERPTVERIRAQLGTGSPNTVIRHLESWWSRLGNRLISQRATLMLPDAPPEVVSLASQWWELALSTATDAAQLCVAVEREGVAADRRALAAQDAARQDQLHRALSAADQAAQARVIVEQRLADLRSLCDQQRSQLVDMTAQRDEASERALRLESELAAQVERSSMREAEQAKERLQHTEHLRIVEDRAHAEIDHVRVEAKILRKQLESSDRSHQLALDKKLVHEVELRRAIAVAEREAAVAKARIETLVATRRHSKATTAKVSASKARVPQTNSSRRKKRTDT